MGTGDWGLTAIGGGGEVGEEINHEVKNGVRRTIRLVQFTYIYLNMVKERFHV
jgi:hypothetical protein